jgi:hypothetical protein
MAKVRRGKRLTKTGRYTITARKGRKRSFIGRLMSTFNFGKRRIALFYVPKSFSR